MYDIRRLEEQWHRYRRKRLNRYLFIIASVLLFLGVPLGYYLSKQHDILQKNAQTMIDNKSASGKRINQSEKGPIPAPTRSLHMENVAENENGSQPLHSAPRQSNMVESIADDSGNVEAVSGRAPSGKIRLEVHDAKSDEIVKEIEKRFSHAQNYDDAIYLARYYYDKHEYSKAEHWAMQANILDSGQEESWLLYAKSKAKQGRRVSALRVLQAYFDQTGSLRAKELIDRIRKGEKF
jgi:hypothetical protein